MVTRPGQRNPWSRPHRLERFERSCGSRNTGVLTERSPQALVSATGRHAIDCSTVRGGAASGVRARIPANGLHLTEYSMAITRGASIALIACSVALASCGSLNPLSRGDRTSAAEAQQGIGVNSFLWR